MRNFYFSFVAAALALFSANTVNAALETSASALDGRGDVYGYTIAIDSVGIGTNVFRVTLTNDSDLSTNPEALIDAFAFNLQDPDPLSGEITFSNFNPNSWAVQLSTGGVRFDYTGSPDDQSARLAAGATLTFDITFSGTYNPGGDFSPFLEAEISSGAGFGGGGDSGQVAVSFQQIASNASDTRGNGSDLLASDWEDTGTISGDIPEPASLAVWGLLAFTGVGGVAARRRRNLARDQK